MAKIYQKHSDSEMKIIDDTPREEIVSLSDLENKKKVLQDNLNSITANYNTNKARLEGEIAKVDGLIIEAEKLGIEKTVSD
jgi:hypothetical protein